MKRNFILVLVLCLLPLGAMAQESGELHRLTHDGREREYRLLLPGGKSSEPRPLVIVLHGAAGSPANVARTTGFSELAARENFIVAYPAGTGRVPTWNAGKCCGYAERGAVDDVGFIRAMLAEIKGKTAIDPARIYATGLSNGGMMTYRLACEMGDVFAAIAVVAGAMNTEQCQPEGRPSVMVFHAVDDRHVPFMGGRGDEGLRAVLGKTPPPDASVGDAMRFWLEHDYCRNLPDKMFGDDYEITNYFCAEGRNVRLVALKGGGHSWPGSEKTWQGGDTPLTSISATERIWEFFKEHPPREVF